MVWVGASKRMICPVRGKLSAALMRILYEDERINFLHLTLAI